MKIVYVMLFTILLGSAAFAQEGAQQGAQQGSQQGSQEAAQDRAQNGNDVVRWKTIVGVITAQGVNNPVSDNINSGTFAWNARGGHARVNLATGAVAFDVEGLVINGTSFSGTPGPVSAVTGTVVCNAGTDHELTNDTQPVTLSTEGNARFAGQLANPPIACQNPLFLIRIFTPQGAQGRWIATGSQRFYGYYDE
jgi:hypothetical protein